MVLNCQQRRLTFYDSLEASLQGCFTVRYETSLVSWKRWFDFQ